MLTFKNITILSGIALFLAVMFAFSGKLSLGWVFLIVIFWLGFVLWGAFRIQSGVFVKSYCKGDESANKIALTFDDGPHPATLQVLELLEKHHAKATFFCIGKQIEKYPEIFQKTIAKNHTVANHSYSHDNLFGFFSAEKVKKELVKTDALIERYSGKKPAFFRPPFGVTNPHIKKALQQTKHHTIGWNVRSLDTAINDETKILNRIKKRIKPGSIVLLHDTSEKTANVLEQLLLWIDTENYELVSVDNLLNIPAYDK